MVADLDAKVVHMGATNHLAVLSGMTPIGENGLVTNCSDGGLKWTGPITELFEHEISNIQVISMKRLKV